MKKENTYLHIFLNLLWIDSYGNHYYVPLDLKSEQNLYGKKGCITPKETLSENAAFFSQSEFYHEVEVQKSVTARDLSEILSDQNRFEVRCVSRGLEDLPLS